MWYLVAPVTAGHDAVSVPLPRKPTPVRSKVMLVTAAGGLDCAVVNCPCVDAAPSQPLALA